ncbi:MAG: Mur ligase family protein [Spirochaetota bacterium]|nr:Mur ligase family protein [Spirochaetota bacterium]
MTRDIHSIYMIGICGIAMGTLACMLKQMGFNISGSDDNVYPPMSDILHEWNIDVHIGFNADNIDDPDLIIIGNAISRGNVEAEYTLNRRIPYLSMAQALYNFFLRDKEVVSVSGTHGKTTTTALLSHILEHAGGEPSFFIGGVSRNYNTNFKLGLGKYFIIEGDEYDSAFFEKFPKFILYRPHHLVLTSLEFDHADIYNSLDEIKLWFKRLVNIIPSEGNIILSHEYPHLSEVVSRSYAKCYSFGNLDSDICYEFLRHSGDFSELKIRFKQFNDIRLVTKLFGDYNYANIAAAVSMALLLGVNEAHIQHAVKTFKGVKRRQELIFSSNTIKIYEDFAHHPTEISSFLNGLRKRYPDSILWAIYEPRSATSRRNIFQDELSCSFAPSNRILFKRPFKLQSIPESDRIDIERVQQDIINMKRDAFLFNSVDEIVDFTFREIDPQRDNVIAIMSNGGFDNIYEKMTWRAREIT